MLDLIRDIIVILSTTCFGHHRRFATLPSLLASCTEMKIRTWQIRVIPLQRSPIRSKACSTHGSFQPWILSNYWNWGTPDEHVRYEYIMCEKTHTKAIQTHEWFCGCAHVNLSHYEFVSICYKSETHTMNICCTCWPWRWQNFSAQMWEHVTRVTCCTRVNFKSASFTRMLDFMTRRGISSRFLIISQIPSSLPNLGWGHLSPQPGLGAGSGPRLPTPRDLGLRTMLVRAVNGSCYKNDCMIIDSEFQVAALLSV